MTAQAEALTMRDDARSWHAKHGGFGDLITEVQPIWQIGDHVESRRSVPAICAYSYISIAETQFDPVRIAHGCRLHRRLIYGVRSPGVGKRFTARPGP